MAETVVVICRVEMNRELYDAARKEGYTRDDMRQAIKNAGIAELEILVCLHEKLECDDQCDPRECESCMSRSLIRADAAMDQAKEREWEK